MDGEKQVTDPQLLQDVDRADKAERLMRDETLQQTFEHLKQVYTDSWEASGDTVEREKLWYCLQALNDLKRHLAVAISRGKIAHRDMELERHGGQSE